MQVLIFWICCGTRTTTKRSLILVQELHDCRGGADEGRERVLWYIFVPIMRAWFWFHFDSHNYTTTELAREDRLITFAMGAFSLFA